MGGKKGLFDIIKHRNKWFIISILIVIPGIISLLMPSRGLNYGVEFTGGRIIRFQADRKISTTDIENVFSQYAPELKHSSPQILSGGKEFTIRIQSPNKLAEVKRKSSEERKRDSEKFNNSIYKLKLGLNHHLRDNDHTKIVLNNVSGGIDEKRITKALADAGFTGITAKITSTHENPREKASDPRTFNTTIALSGATEKDSEKIHNAIYEKVGGYREFESDDSIDQLFGTSLKKRAGLAVLIASIGILIYVAIRFEFWFALAAIVALIHDLLITIGLYTIFQLEVDSTFVAVVLTIFGYSINDTIVIFDRIRENLKKDKKSPFDTLVNNSLWETMTRSINTVLTVELSILAIMIFGGLSVKTFALGLFVGIGSGCYSSIFIAAPLAFVFKSAAMKRAAAKNTTGKPGQQGAKTPGTRPITSTDTPTAKKPSKTEPKVNNNIPKPPTPDDSGDSSKSSAAKKKGKQRRR